MSVSLMFQRLVGLFIILEALLLALESLVSLGWGQPLAGFGLLAAAAFFCFAFHLFDTGYPEERRSSRFLFILLVVVIGTNLIGLWLDVKLLLTDEWSAPEVRSFYIEFAGEVGISLASVLAVVLRIRATRLASGARTQRGASRVVWRGS